MRGLVLVTLLSACAVGGDPAGDSKAGAGLGSDVDSAPAAEFGSLARVCAAGTTTSGVDVSYFNGTIDWAKVKAAGNAFAFIRISDGTGFHDPQFAANWSGAHAAGVIRGIYQFFRPSQDVAAQADMVIAAVGTPAPGDLPPVIDVEATGSLSPASVAARVRTWVDRVKAGTGLDPIVYTGKFFWRDQVGGPTSFARNPLWIAQYTTLCPDLTSPWDTWDSGSTARAARSPGCPVRSTSIASTARSTSCARSRAAWAAVAAAAAAAPTTCSSATMDADLPDGVCVQAASDQKWYQCSGGSWLQQATTAGCTKTYGWCQSATLGRAVPPRTCVQKATDSVWYQCDGTTWVTPVDSAAATGPAGACSHEYPL